MISSPSLYFDKNESICYSLHWEHYFQHIIQKYNDTYKVQMSVITPHVCRHTYCSNMASHFRAFPPISILGEERPQNERVRPNTFRDWDMFIIDALIANFDRHGSNWGFIKKDNKYRLSPIFDNGSSLFPQLNTDEKIEAVLDNQEEIDMRIYKFPTLQVKYKGKKSSYYEIISSLEFEECNNALVRIVERIDFKKINKLIDSMENISKKRNEFYKTILEQRYEKILLKSYNELMSK